MNSYSKPIPHTALPADIADVDFLPCEFTRLKADKQISIAMQYPVLGCKNAIDAAYLRTEAAERLHYAASLLPPGYTFIILDAWRPFALQKELYHTYYDKIVHRFALQNKTEAEKELFIKRYISLPTENRDMPPVHTTGGAVDLTLALNGVPLDMGTAFDEFTDKTATDYFEDTDCAVRCNRRLLYNIMLEAGFTNLPSEWWHYDYFDRYYACYTGTASRYRGVFSTDELVIKQ